MAITSAVCSSFKQELLQGKHSFESSGGSTFKLAMFTSSASLGAATTDYSTSNEITNTSGSAYSAGGIALTNTGVGLTSTTAFTDGRPMGRTHYFVTASDGSILYPPLPIIAYAFASCKSVVVIPCPNDAVSSVHFSHLNGRGVPTSSNSKLIFSKSSKEFKNFL